MKLNYPELRGTEIIITREYLLPIKCTVIGVEYHKGITIVDSLDPEMIRVCLIREAAIRNKYLLRYRRMFHALIKAIHQGEIHKDELYKIFDLKGPSESIPPSSCPFSK